MTKKRDLSEFRAYIGIQLVVSIIAALLIVFTDFGGFYYRDYYHQIDVWGYVFFGSGILTTILLIILVGGLGLVAYSSIEILKKEEITQETLKIHSEKSLLSGTIVTVMSLLGLAAMFFTNLENSWWMDTGFYAALFGGILMFVFGRLLENVVKNQS